MKKLVEVRTYRLKPGMARKFQDLVSQQALPMLRQHGIDVVAFGRSDHEHESFYLIRAFDDYPQLVAQQGQFYSSPQWRSGPRESLLDCIETYLNTLLWLSPSGIEDLRAFNQGNVV